MSSTGALPGFRDFYPAECAEREHVFRAWRAVARRHAFVEYDGPPLESLELYTKKSGSEIVDQLYAFEDKGGRQVATQSRAGLPRAHKSPASLEQFPAAWPG